MGKKLKIGFAMGGGVSLGTFSGSALSEAIKQAILYGGYKDENEVFQPYTDVVIDVFSGASAGMMSLTIMLRALAHQTDDERKVAHKNLEAELGVEVIAKLKNEQKQKYDQLVAAQVVQDIQASIWIEQINIDRLLGYFDSGKEDLTFEPGLLARKALTKIASDNFKFDFASEEPYAHRKLLANRVLVATALANLTPVKYDARKKDDPSYHGLEDAQTSYYHRELRVFDLNFETLLPEQIESDRDTYPGQWLRYHLGEKTDGYLGDFRSMKAWSKIVSSGIACGAFPFAFEPVVLKRHDFEYGLVRDKQGNVTQRGDWPVEFNSEKHYYFSYIDGGTFNNEPIREAYRLATFQDAGEKDDFDRVIIFVDPNIAGDAINYSVPIHKQYYLRGKPSCFPDVVGYNMEKSTTADRLVPHIGTVVKAILNQSKVNEHDKINRAMKMFKDAMKYNEILMNLTERATVDDAYLVKLKMVVDEILLNERINEILPPGAVTLEEELLRIRRLNKFELSDDDIANAAKGKFDAIAESNKKKILNSLLILLVDLMMGLGGKATDSKTIGIAPMKMENGKLHTFALPGGHLAAFSGFTSPIPNIYAATLGKYCAQLFMKESGLIGGAIHKVFQYEPWTDLQQAKFHEDYKEKLGIISARIEELLTNTRILNISNFIDRKIMEGIAKKISKALTAFELQYKKVETYLFKIPVKDDHFQIGSSLPNSEISAIDDLGQLCLMIELDFVSIDKRPGIWVGEHVQDGCLKILKDRFLIDGKPWCRIELPNETFLQGVNLCPNPVISFSGMIEENSKGEKYGRDFWHHSKGVIPLEDYLLT